MAVAVLASLAKPAPAHGQTIEFRPRRDHPDEVRLARLLETGAYTLWTRDTVLARGTRVEGDVLVLEAAVRLGGDVTGSITVVDGDLFLRPGARIRGDVLVLGGGYYGSTLAVIDGQLRYRPSVRYQVVPRAGGLLIHALEERPETFRLHGLSGIKLPTYDRVNEWSFGAGATLTAAAWPWRPSLELVGRIRTENGDVDGTLRQLWHPTRGLALGVEAERNTISNEDWIRGDLSNSISFLFSGDDFRNYYEADRVAFVVKGSGARAWTPGLEVQWEEARSLAASPQTVLFGDDPGRPNPAVAGGDVWSAALSLDVRRERGETRLAARVRLEGADRSIAGDYSYLFAEGRLSLRVPAASGHAVELFGLVRGDLAGTLAPRRRSALGGRGTLPTFSVLALRGDRITYGQATYLVAIDPLDLGPLGVPQAFVREAVGAAWSEGEDPVFEHNLMVGLRVLRFEATLAVDPRTGDTEASVAGKLRAGP